MTTIKDSGQLLIATRSSKMADVPEGKIRITTVQYRTYEYDVSEFNDQTFQVHDANLPEARIIAKAVAL